MLSKGLLWLADGPAAAFHRARARLAQSLSLAFALLTLPLRMSASDPTLHPLGQSLGPGEIRFLLRDAAIAGESFGIEATYRPHRERDVKKTRRLGLFSGWIGGNSGDLVRTQREEFHLVRQHPTATNSDMAFVVPLHDPEPDHEAYQLESVRIVGRVTGTIEFQRWFPGPPPLEAGFGLQCQPDTLRGVVRSSGLGAHPLRGSLPLWPTLRQVDVVFRRVKVPTLRLFDAMQKHHWDGWRQGSPESWAGGQTTVVGHTNSPTVWREHEYHPFPSGREAAPIRPHPPAGVTPGVQLEVFWPSGDTLDFPETRFDGDVQLISTPLSKLPARAAALLAESVRLRPGLEPSSLSAAECKELEESLPELDRPLTLRMTETADGGSHLRVTRGTGFNEPWLCIFLTPYDDERRLVLTSLILNPEPWRGPLPR